MLMHVTRVRGIGIALLVALATACSSPSASPQPSSSVGGSASASPAATEAAGTSPLDGTWITPRLTRDEIGAALAAGGFDEGALDEVFPIDLVVDWYMAELVIRDGQWLLTDLSDGVPIGRFEGTTEFVDASTVVVTGLEDCGTTYQFMVSADELDIEVADATCPGDLAPETATYESAPFHRADATRVTQTEPPGQPGGTPKTSTSSTRISLHPLGSIPDASIAYAEYLPPGYGDGGPRPLLVFLHGSGESAHGDEDALPALFGTGLPALIEQDQWPDEHPFVVLMPQHIDLEPSYCFEPGEIDAFLRFAIAHYQVDPGRVYLTGLSCGAVGAWNYLGAHTNEVVAAAVLIAGIGYGAVDQAGCGLGSVPIWAVHGGMDDILTPNGSAYPIAYLQRCTDPPAVDARLTTYPLSGHDAWTRTYEVSTGLDIYDWMLGYQR
jgi:hypothetical protein